MKKAVAALALAATLIALPLAAEKKWEKKPPSEWSDSEVRAILYNSPWFAVTNVVFLSGKRVGAYQVRLLSAAPMREAHLRMGALHSFEPTVNVREFEATPKENEAARQEKFLASEQGKLLTQLEERYVVVSLTIDLRREKPDDNFLPSRFADITLPTVLINDKGRQVRMSRFIPPGNHRLGALFFFPRHFPDGTPLITSKDKELIFRAKVKSHDLTAKFKVRKMIYKGRLEY